MLTGVVRADDVAHGVPRSARQLQNSAGVGGVICQFMWASGPGTPHRAGYVTGRTPGLEPPASCDARRTVNAELLDWLASP
jgi:hypothetical protein